MRFRYRLVLASSILAALPSLADEAADIDSQILITASRLGDFMVGSASSVISAADIAADPAADLSQILARQSGVQLQSLFGGVNGVQAAISLRGFGATATENTLILVNGRRINDPDQSNIDFSAIPLASIERIEITRGNSAAVLYGDGAVGGAINIITRNGSNSAPGSVVEGSVGSYQYRALNVATNQRLGDTALSFYGSDIVSNGYRDNNSLRDRNFDAEIRQSIPDGELYLNLRGEDQSLGLPGNLPLAQWRLAPKSTDNPYDYGDVESVNATLGAVWRFADGVDLVIDGGLRHKEQQSDYESFTYFYGTAVTTFSVTPRLTDIRPLLGLESKLIAGLDFYQSYYRSFDSEQIGAVPFQNNLLAQRSLAAYAEESLSLSPTARLGFGLRLQQADLSAKQRFDPFAPGYYPSLAGTALHQTDDEYAAHLGYEQGIGIATLFARLGHAMRMPNMDDRNLVVVQPTDFRLKTQLSNDVELGLQAALGRWQGQTRLFAMNLHDEIDYDPAANFGLGANVNLAPTRRYGIESELALQVIPALRLNGNVSLTQAEFRAGPYQGQMVPQVARLAGNVGANWAIWADFLSFDGTLRAIGPRRLGDDFTGQAPAIPGEILVDAKLSGRLNAVYWSLSAQNLMDHRGYELGFYSGGAIGVYPLAGRDVIFRLGVTF